jgi:hypothetical protein
MLGMSIVSIKWLEGDLAPNMYRETEFRDLHSQTEFGNEVRKELLSDDDPTSPAGGDGG